MASSSVIKTLIESYNNSLSDPKLCLQDVNTLIDKITQSMTELSQTSYEYMTLYDDYDYKNTEDADLLKEKLKENIIKVINDEIR